jgi:NAD(P)-dependent dehydrogenase (short-subunit alcohol dehydrogenase family)
MKSNKVALVTGGTGKLGQLFLKGFATLGYTVLFTTRDAKRADFMRANCLTWGARDVRVVEADLASDVGVSSAINQLKTFDVWPTVIVNNARSVETLRVNGDGLTPWEHWHGEFQIGVVAAYQLTMACAQSEAPPNSVINISSIYGVTAANRRLYERPDIETSVNYGVVKAGLIHLTKELAVRLAPRVRVNAVSFGGVRGRASEAFEHRYSELCPGGRMLTDDDVFGPIAFLAGSASSGMTGHNIVVDGGWTVW